MKSTGISAEVERLGYDFESKHAVLGSPKTQDFPDRLPEPYLSRFSELVRSGAGAQDIHDCTEAVGYATTAHLASAAFIAREIERVRLHKKSTCRLLEACVGRVGKVLDAGCSTGGLTVALAMSPMLQASRIVGVDVNALSLRAAEVRADGYNLSRNRVQFLPTEVGESLPFPNDEFDLTVCVSVLEFIPRQEERFQFAAELQRVTRKGGYLFVGTPNPYRLRELHSRRFLGDFIRREGFPWASSFRQLRKMFYACIPISLQSYYAQCLVDKIGSATAYLPSCLASTFYQWGAPWQKLLMRKPE